MDKNRITIIILSVVLLVLINYLALNEFFDSQEEKLERSFEEGYELGVSDIIDTVFQELESCNIGTLFVENKSKNIIDLSCVELE